MIFFGPFSSLKSPTLHVIALSVGTELAFFETECDSNVSPLTRSAAIRLLLVIVPPDFPLPADDL